jgi:SAM-dependent methyltransferase
LTGNDEALRQWNNVASGWLKWEPVHNRMLAAATQELLDRAGVAEGGRVIDIATGAGDQALAAARRVGPAGYVLATDLSPIMLEFVAEQAQAANLANIATHACAADDLPRDQAPFDSVICRLGLMLMPNPTAVVAAMRDVLRPGGYVSGLVMASPAANPFYVVVPSILRRHANKPAPASGPGFFALADPAVLTELFASAGLSDVTVTTFDASYTLPSSDDALAMLQEAFGGIRGIIADQPQSTQDAAWAEVRTALGQWMTPDGFAAPTQFHVASGRKPL